MASEKPTLLISDERGEVLDIPGLEASGMKGGEFFRLDRSDLIKLPADSELFMLPDRRPVGYDPIAGKFVEIDDYPFSGVGGKCFAVAAFLSPGYTATYCASYKSGRSAGTLPLFSYAAVAFFKGEFYAAGVRVDREKRQALCGMDMGKVRANVKAFRKLFPVNRLIRHLETCALKYGCPAAKNFFLKRYECPLPASPSCNARCVGCISSQPSGCCPSTQSRITFVPDPEEIAEVALFHIREVDDPVVSFGQGCEGEPLMAGNVLEKAVSLIRGSTTKGIINLNTNASRPDVLKGLLDAGLDSIRVSLNSTQEIFYNAYYRPNGYSFKDVIRSIRAANRSGAFVSINYLVMPGFTDMEDEVKSLAGFLRSVRVNMIQWRNLNIDPGMYFRRLGVLTDRNRMIGIKPLINMVEKEYPDIMKGYFNPSRRRIMRHINKRCGKTA